MARAFTALGSLVMCAAMSLAAAPVARADAAETLEAALRARRPDILRWETVPVERAASAPASAPEQGARAIVLVGRVGARTAVRLADGRVRWYAVAGYRPVLVAAHAVESGAALSAADAVTAERDVIGAACQPATLDAGTRWRALRRLTTGDALCASAVGVAPEVERDRRVTLTTERGAITATRVLVAASDSRTGERVRLRDPATGETVIAIVTGAAAARVPQESP